MINDLDPELFDKIENCLNAWRDFRIGGRGICVDFIFYDAAKHEYKITIPRASTTIIGYPLLERDIPEIDIYPGGSFQPKITINLCDYTRVTIL